MLLTITITSAIANAFLLFNYFKQNSLIKELNIKLKITRDYANREAKKSLNKKRADQSKTERSTLVESTPLLTDAATEQKTKKPVRRSRKKKPNNIPQ